MSVPPEALSPEAFESTNVAQAHGRAKRIRKLLASEWVLLSVIVLLGVGLRIGWVMYAHPDPLDGRFDDTRFYHHLAVRIVDWDGYRLPETAATLEWAPGYSDGHATALWPPGYPAILAVPYKLFGKDPDWGRGLNVAAAAASIALIYLIGRQVFNRRAGMTAALLLAVLPGHIYFTGLLLTEIVFTMLFLAILWLLIRLKDRGRPPPLWAALLAGTAIGATALVRSEAILLVLVALVFWRSLVPSWRVLMPQASLVLVGTMLVMMPWTVRNYVTMDAFVPTSSGGGHTFFFGHRATAHDITDFDNIVAFVSRATEYEHLPYPEREIKFEQDVLREGFEYAATHPLTELSRLRLKALNLFRNDSAGLQWIQTLPTIPQEDVSILSKAADSMYFAVLAGAALATPLWWSFRDPLKLLLVLAGASWIGTHLLFAPDPRYHVPLLPLFCLAAAVGAVALYERLSLRFGRHEPHQHRPARHLW